MTIFILTVISNVNKSLKSFVIMHWCLCYIFAFSLTEEQHSLEAEKIYSTSSENNISRNKERKEMADKLKNKTSAEMLKKQKKVVKVMRKVKKVKLNKALRFCKSINTNKHVKKKEKKKTGSSWKNKSIGNHTKKCGRFRFRWKSGIWKKPKHSPSSNSKHSSLKAKLLTRKSVFQSLMVDVGSFVSPMVSLSPLSAASSKSSPCFEVNMKFSLFFSIDSSG